jgi:hypothetical protein
MMQYQAASLKKLNPVQCSGNDNGKQVSAQAII